MKTENRKAISFVLTMALIISCFFPHTAVYGEEPVPKPTEAKAGLSDISGHWGESAIQKAVEAGFVQGYEDGSFKPNNAVKRAEFVSMVNKALQLSDENTLNLLYSDVKKTDWFYTDIQKASYTRYVSGVSETSFMPKKNITRQEAAAMLARILPNSGGNIENALSGYPDAAKISSWARAAMDVVVERGYLKGYSNGNLAPSDTLTRAEAAKIIGMILEKETIVREDISLKNANEILQNKIYVGNITIEKSVGEGDASLVNLTALGKVYVLGGGTNTVTVNNSTIVQLIVCKEGTKVRVLSDGDTSIYEAFVFNDNLLVNSQGNNAETGEGGYSNVIRLSGTVSAETAIRIANEIGKRLDNTGNVTEDQVSNAVASVVEGADITVDSRGNIIVTIPSEKKTSGSRNDPTPFTVNGKAVTLSAITEACPCSMSISSAGAFSTTIEFYPESTAVSAVTGFAIYTAEQLQHLAIHLNSNAVLMNNLDFTTYAAGSGLSTPMGALKAASEAAIYISGHTISDFETGKFVPIGESVDDPYTGIFCGNGRSITGLTVSGSALVENVGLFGCTTGSAISNLSLIGGTVVGDTNVGSVVGHNHGTVSAISSTGTVVGLAYVGGVVGYNCGTNANVNGSDNTGAVNGNYLVGGVVGMNSGSVNDSHNTGSVIATTSIVSTGDFVGGIVGANTGTVDMCYNTGAVIGEGCAGGVSGDSRGTLENSHNTGAVSGAPAGGVVGVIAGIVGNCYNTGTVTSTILYAGGVAGFIDDAGSVGNCYNTGTVIGPNNIGGVAGFIGDEAGSIRNCYNTGTVMGTEYIGGVVGGYEDGTVSDSYNTGAITGINYVGGVVGRSFGTGDINAYWLEGTNDVGISTGGVAISFGVSSLPAIYTSMTAITESAGGDVAGSVYDVTFDSNDVLPNIFNSLQGSYITSAGSLTITVDQIRSSEIAVTTGSSLGELITQGGIEIEPIGASNNEYILTNLVSGTWVLIKAIYADYPERNRVYTIYKKP